MRRALRRWQLHDWHVRKTPLVAQDDGTHIDVPKHSAVIRDVPGGLPIALGTIGRRNTPIQNEELADLIMRILSLISVDFVDAGYTGLGEQVFLVCDIPSGFVVISDQPTKPPTRGDFEVVAVNRHDGGALWFHVVPRGTWKTALRPLFDPRSADPPATRALKEHALSSTRLRHNASRAGIATKLRADLRLDREGGGPLRDL
ncbi:hypothetical protein [Microbacterium sp.]|uniref:hypothetical protein n=1 Tax=Microbacterium sp. TaxID=51671 RepID=UPI0028113677|nr:hypothetical protein [Microbacterium sp.]